MWPWERSVSRMVANSSRHPEAESEIACREAYFQNRMELSRLTPYPWVAFFLCGMALWFNIDGGGTPESLRARGFDTANPSIVGLLTSSFENPACPPWLLFVILAVFYPYMSVANRILGNTGILGVLLLAESCATLGMSLFMSEGYIYGSSGFLFGGLGAAASIGTRADCLDFINPNTTPKIPRLTEFRTMLCGRGPFMLLAIGIVDIVIQALRESPRMQQHLNSFYMHIAAFVVAYIATSLYPKKLSADFESRWPWAFSALYLTLFSTWYLTLLVCGGG